MRIFVSSNRLHMSTQLHDLAGLFRTYRRKNCEKPRLHLNSLRPQVSSLHLFWMTRCCRQPNALMALPREKASLRVMPKSDQLKFMPHSRTWPLTTRSYHQCGTDVELVPVHRKRQGGASGEARQCGAQLTTYTTLSDLRAGSLGSTSLKSMWSSGGNCRSGYNLTTILTC